MTKYDTAAKLKIVQQCMAVRGTMKAVCHAHRLDYSTVRRWVDAFRVHGVSALAPKCGRYSPAFRHSVVIGMRRDGLSLRQAAARFDVRSPKHIRRWCEQYDRGGLPALSDRPRTMPPRKSSRPKVQLPDDQRPMKDLIKELSYLRAENAYLKKLDALIREDEEAAQASKREQSKD